MIPQPYSYFAIVILIGFSGLFSGLTLGLLGLDTNGLEIVAKAGTKKEAACAKKIMPVRASGNLLLCTLLFGNVLVNTMLSVLMADLTSGFLGAVIATMVIFLFGEILPQSTCSRYALQVGAFTVPIVKVLIVLLYVISKPLAMILDCVLGEELGTVHSKGELKELMKMEQEAGILCEGVAAVVHGALELWESPVLEVMTPLKEVYMLPGHTQLDFNHIAEIHSKGFSGVPIYNNKQEITSMLLTKDLVLINWEDSMPADVFTRAFSHRMFAISGKTTLGTALQVFQTFRAHQVLVIVNELKAPEKEKGADDKRKSLRSVTRMTPIELEQYIVRGAIPLSNVLGILSHDDCMNAIFKGEIDSDSSSSESECEEDFDRLNQAMNAKKKHKHLKRPALQTGAAVANGGARLLTEMEVTAIAHHLLNHLPKVSWPPVAALEEALRSCCVACLRRIGPASGPPSEADTLFTAGEPWGKCLIVLSGHARVTCGKDDLSFDAGSMTVLGGDALLSPDEKADFSAHILSAELWVLSLHKEDLGMGEGIPKAVESISTNPKSSNPPKKSVVKKKAAK